MRSFLLAGLLLSTLALAPPAASSADCTPTVAGARVCDEHDPMKECFVVTKDGSTIARRCVYIPYAEPACTVALGDDVIACELPADDALPGNFQVCTPTTTLPAPQAQACVSRSRYIWYCYSVTLDDKTLVGRCFPFLGP
jgi:hypothetical protein